MFAPVPRIIEVPFHIGDFLSGTMHMDATETGAYWMLCVAHYQAGEQGLPDDDVQLARIARVNPKMWRKIRPALERKFSVEDGFWRHKRVRNVLLRVSERNSSQQAKSLKRWNAPDAAALPRECRGNPNQKPKTDKVFNPEERDSSAQGSRQPYDVERAVHYTALLKAKKRASELNRDFRTLCALYNSFVDSRGIPGDADAAFLGWLEKFTEGKGL